MKFQFIIDVELERTEGKFASRDEIEEELTGALDEANPSSITAENGGEYEIVDWVVTTTQETAPAPKRVRVQKD